MRNTTNTFILKCSYCRITVSASVPWFLKFVTGPEKSETFPMRKQCNNSINLKPNVCTVAY